MKRAIGQGAIVPKTCPAFRVNSFSRGSELFARGTVMAIGSGE
ncbi:MAG TPA: hypothetical protein VMH22_02805 [bacterium]|nr:hypothetical protein [bacterium]